MPQLVTTLHDQGHGVMVVGSQLVSVQNEQLSFAHLLLPGATSGHYHQNTHTHTHTHAHICKNTHTHTPNTYTHQHDHNAKTPTPHIVLQPANPGARARDSDKSIH